MINLNFFAPDLALDMLRALNNILLYDHPLCTDCLLVNDRYFLLERDDLLVLTDFAIGLTITDWLSLNADLLTLHRNSYGFSAP